MSKIISDIVIPVTNNKPKIWLKPTDQMDAWLDSQGFYRKHIARDASSLFRCVSELVFLTQVHHLNVRKHCIQFAINQPEIFKKLTNAPVKEYVERLSSPREWGTTLDMQIMSVIYRLDFALYKEIKKPVEKVTSNGFRSCIVFSLSYEHHYDSVYPKQHIINAAICQSILYEILYKHVFKLEEVDYAVNKMLHDKTARYQTELNMALFSTGFQMRLEMRDNCRNVKDLLNYGITPFPYKVAKSLDPNIYRNVEYDTWNEQRKDSRHNLSVWNNNELQIGSRCSITFTEKNQKIKRHGYVQQMSPNKGPVVVFVEELGEKMTVPYDTLELIPMTSNIENHSFGDTFTDLSFKDKLTDAQESTDNSSHDVCHSVVMPTSRSCNSSNSTSEVCNVHYVHPTSTAIPTTCCTCITSQSFQLEASEVKSTQVILHPPATKERSKVNYEATGANLSTPVPVHYPVPLYPMMSPDVNISPNVVHSSKTLNSTDCLAADNRSSVRVVYNSPVGMDGYYRYAYPTYQYCVASPGVCSTRSDPSVQQSTDISRMHYATGTYPLTPAPNELYYALPVPNVTSKSEVPVYSPQVIYSSSQKKVVSPSVSNATQYTNIEMPVYRPKDMVYLKESGPINTSTFTTVPTSIYPMTYPAYSPAMYYHSFDYCSSCPDMQSYDNVTPTYQVPQLIPIAYSDDLYQMNAQMYCQPMLPVNHNQ